jgi:hypothetical protein
MPIALAQISGSMRAKISPISPVTEHMFWCVHFAPPTLPLFTSSLPHLSLALR